jgi:hypothetical protein
VIVFPRLVVSSVAFAALLSGGGFPSALAEGPPSREKGGVFPEVEEVQSDEEAKALVDALAKAVEGKEEEKTVEALKPFLTKRHKSFAEPLRKLFGDKRMPVAAAAAEALGSQDDKASVALLVKIVQARTEEKGFYRDILLKAGAVEALARLGEKRVADAVLDLAEDMRKEPTILDRGQPKMVRACVRYFGLLKEKRSVSYLIEEVDQPAPKDPNSGSNPGEAYWKKRHDTWVIIRPDVLWALKEITGVEHENTRRWRKWFEEEAKKGGYR